MTGSEHIDGADSGPDDAVLLAGWRAACTGWRLTRADAAAMLGVPRSLLVGTVPRASSLSSCRTRMQRLVRLAELLEKRTRSDAEAARWVRFPSVTDPGQRRIDLIISSDRFLDAALRLLGEEEG